MAAGASERFDLARSLPCVYVLFAVAAAGRSAVQLAMHASRAPVPYALSALAALIYAAGFVALSRAGRGERARRAAVALCLVELTGVVAIGCVSVLAPADFPDDTVWSRFGSGYGYIPAVLPIAALLWLRSEGRERVGLPVPRS